LAMLFIPLLAVLVAMSIGKAEDSPLPMKEERKRLLQKMLVIGAYLKRRSNLVFLSDKSSILDAKEIELTIGESMDNLEICGISCGLRMELTEPVLSARLITIYDFFEELVEYVIDRIESIAVHIGKNREYLYITVNTDFSGDLSVFNSGNVAAIQDEDGEWRLTLLLATGGDVQ
ncbi:MAG: hypothetical protein PUB37_04850, partial [Firmicutes bacterium]|nr:hypothetical protein [Bacillota bacterium]